MTLHETLIAQNRLRWLDIGNGGRFDDGFEYMDVFPIGLIGEKHQSRYHRDDIVNTSAARLQEVGQFSLVRLQHTLEHLTFEDGYRALLNCAMLLEPDGYILITTPDLRKHVDRYLSGSYTDWDGVADWAQHRIPPDAPSSAYFSVFAHSLTFEPHKWCYDYEGLAYQLERTGKFKNVQQLELSDALASEPFTHNRPQEDVCVLALRA